MRLRRSFLETCLHRPPAAADETIVDSGVLVVSFLFGLIGMGMFSYGWKAGRMVPLGAGVALMLVTYFIPNVIVLLIVCCALTAVPWLVREN